MAAAAVKERSPTPFLERIFSDINELLDPRYSREDSKQAFCERVNSLVLKILEKQNIPDPYSYHQTSVELEERCNLFCHWLDWVGDSYMTGSPRERQRFLELKKKIVDTWAQDRKQVVNWRKLENSKEFQFIFL
jgi:hypothetical protein